MFESSISSWAKTPASFAFMAIHQSFISQSELELLRKKCLQLSTAMTETRASLRNSMQAKKKTTKPSQIRNMYIICRAGFFVSNHATIHRSFNYIERSTEIMMVFLKNYWAKWTKSRWKVRNNAQTIQSRRSYMLCMSWVNFNSSTMGRALFRHVQIPCSAIDDE
jgi:hypothetical protein